MSPAFKHLWGWPLVLGLLTTSALLSALVSDGGGDIWSWLGLGLRTGSVGHEWMAIAAAGRPTPMHRQGLCFQT